MMSTTDLTVIPSKEKIRNPCECGHSQSVHWRVLGPKDQVLPNEGPCHSLLSLGRGQDAQPAGFGEFDVEAADGRTDGFIEKIAHRKCHQRKPHATPVSTPIPMPAMRNAQVSRSIRRASLPCPG